MAGDIIVAHALQRGWLPLRIAILVDQLGADAFEEIMAAPDLADHAIFVDQCLLDGDAARGAQAGQ